MKNRRFFPKALAVALPLAAVLLGGCSKEAEKVELLPETSFSFNFPAMPLVVDSATVSGQGMILELSNAALAQATAAHHHSAAQITGLYLDKARLYFSNPVNSFYDPLKSVTVYMQENEMSAVRVARLDPVPNGAQTLLLKLDDVDILSTVRSGQARLILMIKFDGPIPASTGHVLALGARATVQL